MSQPHRSFIAVDWGTSSFRAYLVDADGSIQGRCATGDGILSVGAAAFADVLRRHIDPWLAHRPGCPVIMSGMIGSRQGWVEAPYLETPATLGEIVRALIRVEVEGMGPIAIVPGIATRDQIGLPDVMRGEETQVIGALALSDAADGVFVLPGTHSKWVQVANGAITEFSTFMTGEVFAVLRSHSILGRLMSSDTGAGDDSIDGFQRGLDVIARHGGGPGGLLNRIFTTRTIGLFNEIKPDAMANYLSGLLIGAEVVEGAVSDAAVSIIGNENLARRYALACQTFGVAHKIVAQDCVVVGLKAIAARAGFIEEMS
jgi:2-dehydro-3-deoxygalactonokinase